MVVVCEILRSKRANSELFHRTVIIEIFNVIFQLWILLVFHNHKLFIFVMASNAIPISTRLRSSSVLAIQETGRPMTAHEIEDYLAERDPELWKQVSKKCYDYVRMILSLSPCDVIVKFRSLVERDGIDQRSAFYGLPGCEYNKAEWALSELRQRRVGKSRSLERQEKSPLKSTPKRPKNESKKTSKKEAEPPQAFFLFPPEPILVPVMQVWDQAIVAKAWYTLASLVQPNDPFWTELLAVLNELRKLTEGGISASIAIQQLLHDHPALTHPLVTQDVVVILSKEVAQKQEEIDSPPGFESWLW
jgi:hypothetical protein